MAMGSAGEGKSGRMSDAKFAQKFSDFKNLNNPKQSENGYKYI